MIDKLVKRIWIEAEEWADGECTPDDDNTDVIVIDLSGKKWIASFFTYSNILSLAEKNKGTGECLGGAYFWASDVILIDEVTRSRIESVVLDLIERGEFESAFNLVDDE